MNFKKVLNTTLLVAAGMIMGATSAWGDELPQTIGATSSGWNVADSYTSAFAIGENQTLKMNFKVNSTRGTYIADGWVTVLCKSNTITDYSNQYLFMRTDCFGVNAWDWTNKTTGGSGWFTCNLNNFYWPANDPETAEDEATTNFQAYISGSTVDLTVKRLGTEMYVTTDVTTATSAHYRHYFLMNSATANETVYAFLAADYANITINTATISASEEHPTLTGTKIGTLNHAVAGIKANPYQSFTLAPEKTITLNFKNYTNKVQIWNNWVVEIQDGTHFLDLRGDGGGWQWAENWGEYTTWWNESNRTKTGYPATDYEYMEAMDGATVELTVARSGSTFNISAAITPISGSAFTETYTFNDENLKSSDVTVSLLCEGAHLDLLPVTKTITSAGWATYCSPYALNLAAAKGLTDAYIVTGGAAGVLEKASVKDKAVPANTGLLLKGDAGTVTIPIVGSADASNAAGNKLVGVTAATAITAETGYVLMDDATNGLGFYKNKKDFTVSANTAYLPVSFDGAGAPAFFSLEGNTTAIETVKAQKVENGEYYNLAGQRVVQPTKGLYIVNGKKVIVK